MVAGRYGGWLPALGMALVALSAAAAPEQRFTAALDQLAAGQQDEALHSLQALAETEPQFRLGPQFLGEVRERLQRRRNPAELASLAEEGRIRLSSEQAIPEAGAIPEAILQLAPDIHHLIAVDLPHARLYVLENRDGALHLVHSHYAAMGRKGWGKEVAGDLRTPIGVYRILDWIDDAELPPLYGAGAYPLDYPNRWDRLQKRTGSGIWLHGVPSATGSRPPLSSEGCVTMANADLLTLREYVETGLTPVLLSDELRWTTPDALRSEREAFSARLEDWRRAAADGDADAYLAHYAASFRQADGTPYDSFAEHVRDTPEAVAAGLRLEALSIYRYPGSGDQLTLTDFVAVSGSDDAPQRLRKQLYWKLEGDGEWRIIREETLQALAAAQPDP